MLECVFVMCLRLRVEKWDPHSGCNVLLNESSFHSLERRRLRGMSNSQSLRLEPCADGGKTRVFTQQPANDSL